LLKREKLSKALVAALNDKKKPPSSVLSIMAHESSGQVLVTLSSDAVVVDDDDNNDRMSISSVHQSNPVQEWLETDKEPPYALRITTSQQYRRTRVHYNLMVYTSSTFPINSMLMVTPIHSREMMTTKNMKKTGVMLPSNISRNPRL
jgi:hypothetical protein